MTDVPRWNEVTPSPFPHEAEGLAIVRKLLPNTSPYRAWSNVEFRDGQGKWHEVDLIVLGQRRLHLVELKYYSGTLRGDDLRWLRDGHRAEDSPLKLARRKAQRLASKLSDELVRWAAETGTKIPPPREVVPFVQESVFLHHPDLRCVLPAASQIDLFGLEGRQHTSGLPGIASRLLEPPTPTQAITKSRDEIITALMARIGLVQRRQREVGSWMIDDEPIGEGEGWQDWSASHRLVGTDRVRIRVRVTPPGAATSELTRTRKLVEHEYRIMSRLAHDGVLRPRDLVDDELGVGLVYPFDESYERLDLWQADHPQGIPLADQLALIRQIAEAVGYAHRHRVVHRGLNPHAVWVKAVTGQALRVQVGDWQAAGAAGTEPLTGLTGAGVTALAAAEASAQRVAGAVLPPPVDVDRRLAEAFGAPEGVWHAAADRVRLDVFSLGALTYFVLAGRPPAADRASLRERIARDRGLDLAADLPQVSSALRTLVLEATRPKVTERLADVSAFLDRLAAAERGTSTAEDVSDPLEAVAGDVVSGRWQVERRLGAGSTAVGLLVSDLKIGTGADAKRVLKVALDDAAAARLEAEAEVLTGLVDPRIAKLVEGPTMVGSRRALVLEPAGERTLADELSGRSRLSLDLLERWGTDVLEALVVLDKAGIDHRDIKPANLGVRDGRTGKHLVLFDFSLARAGATALTAGTPPYLDPFLESPGRGRYDSAAERYAAAVVLFEMATGRPPAYGDGLSDPAAVTEDATVTPGQFDPAVAGPLVDFFVVALARDAKGRHHTAADMLEAWGALFSPVSKTVPDDAEARAATAQPATLLTEAGLSARGLSALEPFGVETVGDLVALDPVRLNRLSGVAEPTRKEVKSRAKSWRDRFASAGTGRGRFEQPDTQDAPTPGQAAALLVSSVGGARSESRRHAAELLLGLAPGLDAFATQAELGAALSLTRPRAAQLIGAMQDAWAAADSSCAVLTDIAATAAQALANLGGVATVDELTGAVLYAMPPDDSSDVPPARLAAGLLRLALDRSDQLRRADAGEHAVAPELRRRASRLLAVATQPDLLDAADALGRRADDLVTAAATTGDPVVAPARAVAALREVLPTGTPWSDDRILALAAGMAQTAAVSGRGELHHRDLEPATALRLALAGLGGATAMVGYGRSPALDAKEIRARVRARFPALPPVPDRPRLDALIDDAGLALVHDDERGEYRAPVLPADTTGLESRVLTQTLAAAGPLSLSAGQLDHRLRESIRARSFLALGVDGPRMSRVPSLLIARHAAVVLDLTEVLLAALRAQADGKIAWDDVVAADAKAAGTREQLGLARLVDLSLPAIDSAIENACLAAPAGTRPVLLTEAAPLARYERLALLARWTDLASPRAQAVWLLVPQLSGNAGAMLDGRPLPLAAPGQFVRLDDEWLSPASPVPA